MTVAVAVVDLQFGSTGKGSIAAYLGEHGYYDVNREDHIDFTAVATNWGPNAGHTSVYDDGSKCIRTMLSNAVHRGSPRRQYIGPGSAINFHSMAHELMDTMDNGNPNLQIFIHENAAVVRPADSTREQRHNRIGSTQKGTAEAWVAKMNRDPEDEACIARYYKDHLFEGGAGIIHIIPHAEYVQRLYDEHAVLLEGCQGYSLGYSSGFWPFVTARECTVMQLLADTMVSPDQLLATIGTARTFPIRVANRLDEKGEMVGYSGPGYPDQREISFADIGQVTEYTTVTKLPRRIFTFSWEQFLQGVNVNGVSEVFMNFLNYLPTEADRDTFVQACNEQMGGQARIRYLGRGPRTNHIERAF